MSNFDSEPSIETASSAKPTTQSPTMTLQKAVDMGEYDPEYLASFPEWHTFSRILKYGFIKQALDNRQRQLDQQYAAIVNVIDFSKKPHLTQALDGIKEQWKRLSADKEKLLEEYAQPE